MTLDEIRDYLLSKLATSQDYPFGPEVEVYRVANKMFATLAIARDQPDEALSEPVWWLNLKCEPTEAMMLRDIFESVIPGYHMNKALWNTIILNGEVPDGELQRMMDNSYDLIVSSLPKGKQAAIKGGQS